MLSNSISGGKSMNREEKIKLFQDVFAPKTGEKILFLVDTPHDNIKDTEMWKDRREMVQDWYKTFKELGEGAGFTVDLLKYQATGIQNSPIPKSVIDAAKKSNLVIAMTEYSATSTLLPMSRAEDTITRCASMPMVEKRMEETALSADYVEVQKYAIALQRLIDRAIGAEITFSTGDTLYMDLRNRNAHSEAGDCSNIGQFINFPSGEAWKAPYEATSDEISEFGESKTEGSAPAIYNGELVKYIIKNNRIVKVVGDGKKAEGMHKFFAENDTRRNIAEFAIGCNPKAVVTGNILEDEKACGLHIGYAMSTQLGGKVTSDMHEDIVYTKGCPVEGTAVILINEDGSKTEIIRDAMLRFEMLK
jgi:leucyl aminopeptidase (aminopeptidase T)